MGRDWSYLHICKQQQMPLYMHNNEEVRNLSAQLAERFWVHLIIMHIQTM